MTRSILFSLTLLAAACGGDDDGVPPDEQEVITTVIVTLAPEAGGAPVVATFDDPDGDGGAPPGVDPINLPAPGRYAMTVRFENRLESPAEDITAEVADEAEAHQIFLTGTAVDGPASDRPGAPLSHTYADTDANGLPLGLAHTIDAGSGTGDLTVTLRHLPEVNGAATKVAGLDGQVRAGGFAAIPGESDASVTFAVTSGAPSP